MHTLYAIVKKQKKNIDNNSLNILQYLLNIYLKVIHSLMVSILKLILILIYGTILSTREMLQTCFNIYFSIHHNTMVSYIDK